MKAVTIHQTLHGYSEGHRLLGGSLKVPDDLSRIILRMSDLSGSNVVTGFEEYVTGYPLEAVGAYALAKTWYAPEMPRPGCVWTHTLFIPFEALGNVTNLQEFTALFLRPQSDKGFSGYSRPIEFSPAKTHAGNLTELNVNPQQLTDIQAALYLNNVNFLLIGTARASEFEPAIFRVWSQQWPQLRRAFCFCTGALSARGFGGKPFDIQCAPISLIREINATAAAKQGQEMSVLVAHENLEPEWLSYASQDALQVNGGIFRRVLWGVAQTPKRSAFGRFASFVATLLAFPERSASELIDLIADAFPDKADGVELKVSLLGGATSIEGMRHFEEGHLLTAIATTSKAASFDAIALRLRERGQALCQNNPNAAKQILTELFHTPVNALGEEILAGLMGAISQTLAIDMVSGQPHFLPALFRARPDLGAATELWKLAGDRKRELFESLSAHKELSQDLIQQIVTALLESDSEVLLRRALDTWGEFAVNAIFDTISDNHFVLSDKSLGALTFHVESIGKWLLAKREIPQAALITAAHIVGPYSYQVKHLDSTIWHQGYQRLIAQENFREANYFAALLVALGLQNAKPEPTRYLEECFETVHQLAWDDSISDDAWLVLEPLVPHLWWLHDWDKCERMRRGLVEAFVKFGWPVADLKKCLKSEITQSRIIESSRHVDGGKELFLN